MVKRNGQLVRLLTWDQSLKISINEVNCKLRKIKWGHHCIRMGFIALIASDAHKMKRFASLKD